MRDVSCGYVCDLDVPQITQMTGIRTTTPSASWRTPLKRGIRTITEVN
jgi:hypothetical protein